LISRFLSSMNRVQQSMMFKIIASCIVVALAIAGVVSYAIATERARTEALAPLSELQREVDAENARQELENENQAKPKAQEGKTEVGKPANAIGTGSTIQRPMDAETATINVYRGIVSAQHSVAGVASGIGVATVLLLVVIWLGLGLTYLLLAGVCGLVLGGLSLFDLAKHWAPIVVGIVSLAGAFFALMKLLGLVLSGSNAIMGIARTVLSEAVRLKVPIVFIVLLLLGLAALPLVLDASQPLRYRVQAFMQYATGGAFWLIAILTILFSITTVVFEQRDKQVWQTMTKPVAPWKYILGKWLGVAALTFALLSTSSAGVFMFVEYLRRQPAIGESIAFKPSNDRFLTEDRKVLETQVLAARRTVQPNPPEVDPNELELNINQRIEQELAALGELASDPQVAAQRKIALERTIRQSLIKNLDAAYRTIEPAGNRVFVFTGLEEAKKQNKMLYLRWSIQSGGNMPDQMYAITLSFPLSGSARPFKASLDQMQTTELLPNVIMDDGTITMVVYNGDPVAQTTNPLSITFPPDKLEISYSDGSFQANFLRCVLVLWVKLLFLSMIAICASTFLSFPVATLVAFTTFVSAEGARYLLSSIDYYETETITGQTLYINTAIAKVATAIGRVFQIYADLRPTTRMVEGVFLSWGGLATGTLVLAGMTAILYVLAVYIFGKRELATYSGH
jgi:hypothetical protein